MFLKKIYIAGFKSFPDPLELDLREGMTAIVGPNGCGKTNISDAVRWCLGEQSPKSLRGNQMADVIFSGAAERKPLGMAEVSLLLSNEGHVLDSPYDEVQITRRLFRSGESAYLLNQRPCRLKDITGLLTDTGIGTKAYSLIEQAQVDQILSKDPRERRLIFDEAAGIGRYKRHRAEARRKLEDVEAQQLRLAERLDEIAVRLRSLRREVRKVEHHKRLGEEIRTYQALMFRHHWEGHQERIDELESSAEKLRDEVLAAGTALETLDAEIVAARSELGAASERLRSVEESRYRSLERVKDYENQLSLNQDRRQARGERRRRLEGEIAELDAALLSNKTERAELDEAEGGAEAVLTGLRDELETAREGLAERRGVFEKLDARVKELGARLMEIGAAVADRERLRAERNARREARREETERLAGEETRLNERRAELEETLAEAESTAAKLEGRLEKLEERRGEAVELQRKANREIDEASRETRRRLDLLTKARARFDSLKGLYSRHEGYRKAVSAVLAAADKGALSGIHGALAQLILSEKRYEAALEAALGASAQAVVCDGEEAAARAIELIKRLRAGRVRFLPLELIRPREPVRCAERISSPGLIDDALGLIDYDPRFAPAVEFALGGSLVVETLPDATRLLREWRGQVRFRRIVSLEGELVESSGAISGGGGREGGLLSRERELDQLRENLDKLETDYDTAAAREKKLRDEFQNVSSSLGGLRDQLGEARLERERAADALEARRTELGRIDERQVEIVRRREALAAAAGDEDEPAEDAIEEVDEESLRTEHDAALRERDLLQARLEKEREAIAELRLQLSRLEGEGETRRRELERLEREHAAAGARRRERERELERLLDEDVEADRETEKLADELARLTLGRDDEEQTLLKLRREQEEAQDAVGTLLEKRAEAGGRRDELRRRLGELELELRGETAERERLVEEARERSGVELDEVELPDEFDLAAARKQIDRLEERRRRLGELNFHAQRSYDETTERRDYLRERRDELTAGARNLQASIRRLNAEATERFLETFNLVTANFESTFGELFGGGEARLGLTEDDPLEAGVEIFVRPPGKGVQELISRSGGERALTAIALLFALFAVKPSPFCVLDEIDAPLDDANVDRYLRLLRRHLAGSQFLVITHNRRTMEAADTLIGVTMDEPGVSRVYSLAFSGGRLVTEEDQRRFSLKARR